MKRSLSLLIFSLLIISCGSAQQDYISGGYQKVLPGDEMLNPSKISEHYVRYSKFGGKMDYRVGRTTFSDKDLWLVEVIINGSTSPDSIFFDPVDLSYSARRLSNEGGGYLMKVDLEQNQMEASLAALPGSDWDLEGEWEHTYDHGMFEIAVMNYFISALPLKEGLKVSMPYHVFSSKQNWKHYWLDVVVEGRETIKTNGTEYDTWKVQSLSQFDGGKTFWIAENVPYAIKIHSHGNSAWTYAGDL